MSFIVTEVQTAPEPWLAEMAGDAQLAERPRIAVLVPCFEEAACIVRVVNDFQTYLPEAQIFVYDNNSTDATRSLAAAAGAWVRQEARQGKGNVVRRMFADVEADIYVLVDGDGTYDASSAPHMVELLLDQRLDMVVGTRVNAVRAAYRRGHRLGNAMLSGAVSSIFGDQVADVMSGYRVFSRRFVKSFPALSSGFETETEFTVHALEMRLPIGQMPTHYRERTVGSSSKLRTYSDGARILRTIILLTKEERPLAFFSAVSITFFLLSLALALPLFVEYARTGLVPRFPTAILATGIMLASFLSLACGLILDSLAQGRKEAKRMAYLAVAHNATGPRG